jgi:hypothetical protein
MEVDVNTITFATPPPVPYLELEIDHDQIDQHDYDVAMLGYRYIRWRRSD